MRDLIADAIEATGELIAQAAKSFAVVIGREFTDEEAAAYLRFAGADALAEAFPTSGTAATPQAVPDDPAAVSSDQPAPPAAGSLTFDELPTSELLNRAATTLDASAFCISLAGYASAIPADELDRFTAELSDRAAQFAAHGD